MAKSKGSSPEGFCSRNMKRFCHILTFFSGIKMQVKTINSSKSWSCCLLTTFTCGNTGFHQYKNKCVCNKIHKYESHFRDLEPKAKTKWVQHGSQREATSRTHLGGVVGAAPDAPHSPWKNSSHHTGGVSGPFWMSCCWLSHEGAKTWNHHYMTCTATVILITKLTKSSSLTIFVSAWNSYLSRGNNLFKGITWANIHDFAHSFVKWFFLQLVSALEAKDENTSPQAELSVLKRNCIVFNGCLKGRNMNEIEENVSQNKT